MAGVPFKVYLPCINVKVGVVAQNLQHLKEVLKEKFGLSQTVISLEDGTIICSEEYFDLLEPQTSLVVQQQNANAHQSSNAHSPPYPQRRHSAAINHPTNVQCLPPEHWPHGNWVACNHQHLHGAQNMPSLALYPFVQGSHPPCQLYSGPQGEYLQEMARQRQLQQMQSHPYPALSPNHFQSNDVASLQQPGLQNQAGCLVRRRRNTHAHTGATPLPIQVCPNPAHPSALQRWVPPHPPALQHSSQSVPSAAMSRHQHTTVSTASAHPPGVRHSHPAAQTQHQNLPRSGTNLSLLDAAIPPLITTEQEQSNEIRPQAVTTSAKFSFSAAATAVLTTTSIDSTYQSPVLTHQSVVSVTRVSQSIQQPLLPRPFSARGPAEFQPQVITTSAEISMPRPATTTAVFTAASIEQPVPTCQTLVSATSMSRSAQLLPKWSSMKGPFPNITMTVPHSNPPIDSSPKMATGSSCSSLASDTKQLHSVSSGASLTSESEMVSSSSISVSSITEETQSTQNDTGHQSVRDDASVPDSTSLPANTEKKDLTPTSLQDSAEVRMPEGNPDTGAATATHSTAAGTGVPRTADTTAGAGGTGLGSTFGQISSQARPLACMPPTVTTGASIPPPCPPMAPAGVLMPPMLQPLLFQFAGREALGSITHSDYSSSPATRPQIEAMLSLMDTPTTSMAASTMQQGASPLGRPMLSGQSTLASQVPFVIGGVSTVEPSSAEDQHSSRQTTILGLLRLNQNIGRMEDDGEDDDEEDRLYIDEGSPTCSKSSSSVSTPVPSPSVSKEDTPASSESTSCTAVPSPSVSKKDTPASSESTSCTAVPSPSVSKEDSPASESTGCIPTTSDAKSDSDHFTHLDGFSEARPTMAPFCDQSARCMESPGNYPDEGYRSATPLSSDTGKEQKSFKSFFQAYCSGAKMDVNMESSKRSSQTLDVILESPSNEITEESSVAVKEEILADSMDFKEGSSGGNVSVDTAMCTLTSKGSFHSTLSPAPLETDSEKGVTTDAHEASEEEESTSAFPAPSAITDDAPVPNSTSKNQEARPSQSPISVPDCEDAACRTQNQSPPPSTSLPPSDTDSEVCQGFVATALPAYCSDEPDEPDVSDSDAFVDVLMVETEETALSVPPTEETAFSMPPSEETPSSVPPTEEAAFSMPPSEETPSSVPPTDEEELIVSIPRQYISLKESDPTEAEPAPDSLVVTFPVECRDGCIIIRKETSPDIDRDSLNLDLDTDIDEDSDMEFIDLTLDDEPSEKEPEDTAPQVNYVVTKEDITLNIHHEEMVVTCCTDKDVDQCVGQLLANEYVRRDSNSIMDRESILELQAMTEECQDCECEDSVFDDVVVSPQSDISNEIVIGSVDSAKASIPLEDFHASENEEAMAVTDKRMLSYVEESSPVQQSSPVHQPCILHVTSSGPIKVKSTKRRRRKRKTNSASSFTKSSYAFMRTRPPSPVFCIESPRLRLLPPRLRPSMSKLCRGPRTRSQH